MEISIAQKTDKLFTQGILIHVTDIEHLGDILLQRGLLSPFLQAQQEGRTVPESTPWHPQDNLYVKFLRLPSTDSNKNIRILRSHFHEFGHLDWGAPIGLIVENNQAIKLFEDLGEEDEADLDSWPYHESHFYGIRDSVLPQDILGIVIFLVGITENPKETLRLLTVEPALRIPLLAVMEMVRKAETKLGKRIRIFDDAGREILRQNRL